MSRTTLCLATAAGLIALSTGLMIARYRILGDEILAPKGPGIWKVTLLVNGTSTSKSAKLMTATPLDVAHQHICRESCRSDEFIDKPPVARHPERAEQIHELLPALEMLAAAGSAPPSPQPLALQGRGASRGDLSSLPSFAKIFPGIPFRSTVHD